MENYLVITEAYMTGGETSADNTSTKCIEAKFLCFIIFELSTSASDWFGNVGSFLQISLLLWSSAFYEGTHTQTHSKYANC